MFFKHANPIYVNGLATISLGSYNLLEFLRLYLLVACFLAFNFCVKTKGLGASLLRNKAAPNSVLQHPAGPAAPTSLSSIISSRSAFETSSEPQTCPLSYAVVPASQVAIANDREPTPKPHRKTNSSGKSSSVKLAARTNRVNELVDRVLAETEDWTGERLFSTYSPSFDYALKIADEPIPFEISEVSTTRFHVRSRLRVAVPNWNVCYQ